MDQNDLKQYHFRECIRKVTDSWQNDSRIERAGTKGIPFAVSRCINGQCYTGFRREMFGPRIHLSETILIIFF